MADADGIKDNGCDGTIRPDKESDGQTSEYDDTKIGQSTEEGEATKECKDLNTSETRKDEASDEVTDNELKEDDKSVNKPAQKQTQNKAVVSDQSSKLKEKLKGEGLDPEFWSNKLETKLGITCSESLAHVSPKDLQKLGPFRYDWEKAALLMLVQGGAEDSSNTEAKKVVKDIKSIIKPGNNFEETAKTKLEPLRNATNIPDGDWVRPREQVNFKEALSSLKSVTETQQITRTELDDNTVIKMASGGSALMGIYFKQNLNDVTEQKKTVIQLCGDITMKGPSIKPEEQIVEFTSREKRDTFNKSLDTTGKNVKIAVNVGVKYLGLKLQASGTSLKDADHIQMENGEEIFYSKEKHSFVPVKSCELKLEHIRLTPDAVNNLVNIESQFNKNIDCGTGLRLCVEFFENYGSHVNIGILHFGGIFTWTATYTSETKSEKFSTREIVNDALDEFTSLGIVGKVSNVGTGISGSYLSSRSNIENKYTESELSHILLKIVPDGGPPDEGDFNKWKHTLVSQNSTWSLVDRKNFCGLWDVLRNHQTDFQNYKTFSILLECAWNMEIVKNSVKNIEHTSCISILKMLCQTIEKLTDLTNTEEFVKTLIQTDDDVLEFFDYIASSPDLQENINNHGIKHLLSFVLNPLRDVFLPGKPNLGAWIFQEIRNLDDFQSVLSMEEIISIDNLLSVLKSKFLPRMKTADVTNRNRNQQTVEIYITKEFTQVCQKLLRTFDTATDKAQFTMLFSLLQKFRYEEKKGFSRLLALSDIEEFVQEVEPCMNNYNQTNKDTDIQSQAVLVNFLVLNIKQYKWDLSEKVFDICLEKLMPCLNDGVKCIINIYTERVPYNWDQLLCDLQPLTKGNEAQELVFSLPVDKILNIKVGDCEKPALSDSHCHDLPNELKELLDKLQMLEYLPDKLKFSEAITIHSKRTLNGLKGLPWFLLETIMVQNSSIYDELEKYMNENSSPQPHVYDDDTDDDGDDNDKEASDDDFFNCLSEEPKESMLINPLDLFVTVFRCCSQPLKQALAAKMYACRLAIPILLPQEPLVFSISILRSIFIHTQGAPPLIAVDCPCNVLSFIRIGRPKYSKSKLINRFLCKHSHDTFFNQSVPLGGTDRRISNGLVETTFFIGSTSERGIQRQNVTMVFNLRGNATRYEKQRDMLSGISSGIVIMTTCEELKGSQILEYVQNLCTRIKVVIALDAISNTKEEVKEIMKPYMPSSKPQIKNVSFVILALKGEEGKVRGSSDINKELRKALQTTIEALPLKSISQRTENSACKYVADVHLNERTAAETMMTNLSGDMACVKKEALPLQLGLLSVLSQNMKKMYKPSQYKTQKHRLEIKQEILKTRMEQLKLISALHPLMISFLHNMLDRLNLDTGYEMFALWVKSFLEIKSRDFQLGMQACNTNTVLGKSDTSSTDILFGFEHLIRELGQLYEAIVEQASMVDEKTCEVAKKFPLIPAKLLLMGLPFELMNGDISHVPIVWVKAVLMELEHLVGIKKCLILSVVGTQSSGKSTLLNAMFGLQFPVGHGRITKGAFVQLIPVNDEQLSYEYILVIDTEGLRAPELGEHNYIHDTEFASFIIGLADINIVNIMGEHSLEMNDVLQMVVHTLLRLKLSKKLNLKQSCVFVHQNVISDDADNALDSTLQQFVKTLNEKTEEAANELDITDIHTFTDVIDFNIKHVWYLPPLVTGSLPMVHTSPNYSLKAAEIRKVLLYDIIPPDKACFTISETSLRIEHIWNGILMENFASEFRNALEVKAFASLDGKYHELQWQLELFMFEFVQEKKCELAKFKYERMSEDFVKTILETIQEVLHRRTEIMINDLQTFISRNTLKNVMIKWEQTYQLRIPLCLQSLSMKAERGLRLIIEELEHVSKCNDIIKNCKRKVNVLASELAYQVRKKNIDDLEREYKFNNAWMLWLAEFLTKSSKYEAGSVGDQVRNIVKDRNIGNTTLTNKLYLLTDEECMHMTTLQGAVKEDDIQDKVHISRYKQTLGYLRKETFRVCRDQAISMTSKLFRQIENYIYELKLQDTRFQDIYMNKILNMVDETIKEHNKHTNNDHQFKVLPPYKALVLTHITGYCIQMFVILDNRYEFKHSPRAMLEKYKETAWTLFNNLIDSKNVAVIAAGFFHEAIEEGVLEYLGECLPGDVENEILKIFKHSKYELMKSVMKDLVKKDVFHYFIMYISEAETYVQHWLINYTNEMLFGESEDGQRGYDKLNKPKVEMVFADIRKSVIYASREVQGKQGNIIPQWTKCFISKTCVLPISEDKLVHMQDRNVTNDNFQNFQRAILNHVERIENTILTKIRETKTENICWKRSPYSCIFERLWGCCETCPFCNEPCEYTDKDHLSSVKHSCRNHRPQGFVDFAWEEGRGHLMTEVCNYLIQTGDYYSLQGSTEKHKYRHYRTKYPEWEISPSNEISKYWMWFYNKYKYEMAKMNKAEPPQIANELKKIGKKEAVDSI